MPFPLSTPDRFPSSRILQRLQSSCACQRLIIMCMPPSLRPKLWNLVLSAHVMLTANRYNCWSAVNTVHSWRVNSGGRWTSTIAAFMVSDSAGFMLKKKRGGLYRPCQFCVQTADHSPGHVCLETGITKRFDPSRLCQWGVLATANEALRNRSLKKKKKTFSSYHIICYLMVVDCRLLILERGRGREREWGRERGHCMFQCLCAILRWPCEDTWKIINQFHVGNIRLD